jgi:hypothetical protein
MFTQPKIIRERTPTVEEMRARLNLDKNNLPQVDNDFLYNNQIENLNEIKKRKQELVNGNKNLLKGIYVGATSSLYQDTFK